MGNKVILTGERQIGKSTALNRFLENREGSVAGFRTLFDTRSDPLNRSLQLCPLPEGENRTLAVWTDGKPSVDIAAFDRFVPPLLAHRVDLMILDELGKFEGAAEEMRKAVERVFDEPEQKVLAVVRYDAPGWMGALKGRSDVTVLTVTMENRDAIPAQLAELLK